MAKLYIDNKQCLSFCPPQKVGALLQQAGLSFAQPCGGQGKCGKCAAVVTGMLSAPSQSERAVLGEEKLAEGYRLCCRAEALGDVLAKTPAVSGDEKAMQVQSSGVFYRKQTDGEAGLGFAVDIGTTTVVAYLYRLADGALLAQASAPNPQRSFGADVISRMQHSMDGQREALAMGIRGCLAGLFARALKDAACDVQAVRKAVIAGNTAMLYFLMALPVESIAFAPFEQDEWFGREVAAETLQLGLADGTPVYLVRSIGAYVGGDITAAALSCLLAEREGAHLLIDIGTNGEMLLTNGGTLTGCSTAAGPALEGAGISCGMSAAPGAVSRIDFDNGTFRFATIGGEAPKGLCGTGVLDMLAALLDAGIVDSTGRMLAEGHAFAQHIETVDGLPAFRLPETDILFTSADVRAVQMAKAAIAAGIETLLVNAGLAADTLKTLFLAGGFGSYVRTESAARIGLIPVPLAQKTVVLGNASGTGAAMMLLCAAERQRAEALAKAAVCTDLATDMGFLSAYTDAMFFS
ncbi:MAG: DUF4445 domain-containing protein [Oscillospiraceae bacterium]|nr:DUF4445 domain-containing protein [Oscillospiraceae bacterium]